MCGIYWLLHTNGVTVNEKTIEASFNNGVGRGPDNSKFKSIKNNFIGFHRLSINDLTTGGDQPFEFESCILVCNGEIYNHTELAYEHDLQLSGSSDCEVIIHLYKKYGISKTLNLLDGVFAFVLYDKIQDTLFVARDIYGVRPLFYTFTKNRLEIASEMKMISGDLSNCIQFPPGKCMIMSNNHNELLQTSFYKYYHLNCKKEITKKINETIFNALNDAVKKRVENTERPIGCLLSGGLDSSIIASLINNNLSDKCKLKTFSIGLEGSVDIEYSRIMSSYLNSDHTEIIVTEEEMLESIPEVIKAIESYDTTTVRASVGNWLIGKKISELSDCKVIFNGDGSDEVTGGYLYFRKAPSNEEFDKECIKLLSNIHYFDVLRSDRCISCHGLEPRTPFLDKQFVETYLRINLDERVSSGKPDKHLLRETFKHILPDDIYKRSKEAFSDGVSSKQKSWYQIIQDSITNKVTKFYSHNTPKTPEQNYYREIYDRYYTNTGHIIPYFWMPNFIEATDASARTLKIYN